MLEVGELKSRDLLSCDGCTVFCWVREKQPFESMHLATAAAFGSNSFIIMSMGM